MCAYYNLLMLTSLSSGVNCIAQHSKTSSKIEITNSLAFIIDCSTLDKLTFYLIILEITAVHCYNINYNYSICWAH